MLQTEKKLGKKFVSTSDSPYAEVENQPSGDSTYQELSEPELDKDYLNLALQMPRRV